MFNKPSGVLSQFTDEGTRHPALKEFVNIPIISPRFVFWILTVVLLLAFVVASPSQAKGSSQPLLVDSPYDLINAVNALRASYGLPAYSVNSILMYTAQAQADFMAATGNVTHTGPSGIGVTDRLLAAGYPLAGDLSLGGFRSENITAGSESMTAQSAINGWTGDAPHLNTMISQNLTEIGAGVAVANGRVYYIIDCARPTTSGTPQVSTQSSGSGSAVPAGEAAIPPAIVSTPNASGEVIHEVQAGQTLWQIAIAYRVKIEDIKALNNLTDDTIYPGETLLIKREVAPASATPVDTPTTAPTLPPTVTATLAGIPSEVVPTQIPPAVLSNSSNTSTIMSFVIVLVALALLAGGYFAWRGDPSKAPE